VTGLILLGFVVCTFTAIRHAPVSAVLAIGAASPIITTLLQVGAAGKFRLTAVDVFGLAVLLVSVVIIIVIGLRREVRAPGLEGAPA
jgi:drug/metabolite transporter (DMT)-like permease